MILTVPKLGRACWRDEGRRGGAVHARHAWLQVVDASQALVEFALERGPACRDAQVVEHRRQAIIGAIAWLDSSADASTERPLMFFDPRFDAIESMVALGEDEGQPHDRHPSETHSRPIAVGGEMFVQYFGHAHVFEL